MTAKDYQRIRDSSWRFLLNNKVMRLPLDLNFILNLNNILHFKFSSSKAKELLKILQIEKLTETDIGIISKINGQFIIFYDEKQFPLGRKRFTFAHEIGHYYLNHH